MNIKSIILLVLGLPFYPLSVHSQIPQDELIGKGNPQFTKEVNYQLRPEAAAAFEKMKSAAQKDGIALTVVSSYRSYAHQNSIWERKYIRFRENGLSHKATIAKIIEYSTIPGTSRHHWGTDLDLIDGTKPVSGDVLVASKFHGTGPFCKMKEWMDKHAKDFGFYLVYTDNPNRKGFNYEPWHYSYAPLAKEYLKAYKKLQIQKVLQQEKLMGSEHFTDAFTSKYLSENVLDINPDLLRD